MAPPKMSKRSFIRSGEPAIASYDWADIANGLGYIELYGMQTIYYNAGNLYLKKLKSELLPSALDYVSGKNTQTIDFDLSPFNTPRTCKGTASIYYSLALNDVYAGAAWAYPNFNIIKVSDGVETSLGNTNGAYVTVDGTGWYAMGDFVTDIDLTQTEFKIGDFIRLRITITARASGAGDDLAIFTNPLNSSVTSPVTSTTSQLKISIPFKILK